MTKNDPHQEYLRTSWRQSRLIWQRDNLPDYKASARWLLNAESGPPTFWFDDSPMPTSLEYLTAWRRL